MPAPTKVWGQAATYNDQPDDSFLDEGLHPELPWPTQFVNWTLNFIWGTLIGTEHDQFTGAHTDVTFDTLTSNTNTPGSVVLPALFEYKSAAPVVVALEPGDFYWAEADVGAGKIPFDPATNVLVLGGGVGNEGRVWVDVSKGVSGGGSATDIVLTNLVLYAYKGAGAGTETVSWALQRRNPTAAGSLTAVASGTFDSSALSTGSPTTVSLSLGGSVAWTSGDRYYLRLDSDQTGPEIYVLGGAALCTRTNHYPG